MAQAPFFSIVSITFQNAAGLRLTLESVARQTFRDFELIVIDGGSSDGTREVAASFAEFLTHFVSEKDRGIAHAFNKGTAVARGTLVNYLNAGDRFLDAHVLARVHDAYQANGPFVWAFGLSKRADPAGNIYPPPPQQLLPYSFDALASGDVSVSHQATFFSLAAVRNLSGYDETFQRQGMEYDLMLRLGARYEPYRLEVPLVLYDATGVSARRNLQLLIAKHAARRRALDLSPGARAADLVRTYSRYAVGRARHAAKRMLLTTAPGRALLRRAGLLE